MAAGAALGLVVPPAVASDGGAASRSAPVTVVASGLSDPWSVRFDLRGRLVVAESGTGEITRLPKPGQRGGATVLATVPGLAGADTRAATVLGITSGPPGGAPDDPNTPPAPPPPNPATLFAGAPGTVSPKADLLAYELKANPDGQVQFVDGQPVDALSNPFSVLAGLGVGGAPLAYVADGGANDVLAVAANGKVSTFFVPPTVTTGACAQVPNNAAGSFGCDSVPTGLAYGRDLNIYIAAFTAGVPGEGRVYVVDRRGRLLRTISGFSGPTGVAVGDDGTVYVSELLEGAPEGEGPPPAGFDPTSIGRIVAVAPDGRRSAAQVTMPLGLQWCDGALYSTAWSVAGQFGLAPAGGAPVGQVVKVSKKAFSPL
ncbi:ScyD/ScyE family protein [Quadrisphaera granulorum]|uniref:ScyD/ScyE family protein n=1 Tax=Quadrisphaera granulorum TaxID=317664 RepID=UPI001476614D|nr:ScyD/ScyE family protein [Quadrisphaera granulorum]